MSTDRDTTRIVRSWLRSDEHESADRVLDAVLDQLDTTPQRRSTWWPARRFPEMNNSVKLALGAVAVVVIALLGVRFLAPSGLSVGGDPGLSASASPTPSFSQIPIAEGRRLDAGGYSLGNEFPVGITFDLPAGWESCSLGVMEQGVCDPGGGLAGIGIGFLIIDNVTADPCDGDLLDPPIGPLVEDLVTAISNLQGFAVTTAVDVSVDGFDATRLTVTAPETTDCEGLSTWATPDRTTGVAPGEANLLYLVDVDGARVMISVTYFPAAVADGALAEAEEVIASIRIEP
jgi:hypothetical protein